MLVQRCLCLCFASVAIGVANSKEPMGPPPARPPEARKSSDGKGYFVILKEPMGPPPARPPEAKKRSDGSRYPKSRKEPTGTPPARPSEARKRSDGKETAIRSQRFYMFQCSCEAARLLCSEAAWQHFIPFPYQPASLPLWPVSGPGGKGLYCGGVGVKALRSLRVSAQYGLRGSRIGEASHPGPPECPACDSVMTWVTTGCCSSCEANAAASASRASSDARCGARHLHCGACNAQICGACFGTWNVEIENVEVENSVTDSGPEDATRCAGGQHDLQGFQATRAEQRQRCSCGNQFEYRK